ncbi:protein that induces appearance of [PIN+] prion when overproduced [Friedmanniomyces endolithicus]|nr:protein that induces appearance of [PIN+] prion when overproduced [Friedmanniomyces endolithicus]KAK1818478.1 protein that induces appearance of [PIN+] prion when overproduced [Friedmanniomyces endolithicus]
MAPMEDMQTAMVNRSIRTIKAELEYLCDASIISVQSLSDLLSRIPEQTALRAPISIGAMPSAAAAVAQPPASQFGNMSVQNQRTGGAATNGAINEKSEKSYYTAPVEAAQPPPPAYNSPAPQANWAPLAQATALYAYTSTDAGDLALEPNDHVNVTEYMNAEWWKGRNTRTGQEGIFPRSYVKVSEDKGMQPSNGSQSINGYGNAPMEVSQGGSGGSAVPSKVQDGGKKFGKKLGNAAIFGAGATIGSQIVGSIF